MWLAFFLCLMRRTVLKEWYTPFQLGFVLRVKMQSAILHPAYYVVYYVLFKQ